MTRKEKIWFWIASAFTVFNVAFGLAVVVGSGMNGALGAAFEGGAPHATGHFVAGLVGGFVAWWLSARARERDDQSPGLAAGAVNDRLANLEQSIDAVALEVERIGEGQRFVTKLFAEKDAQPVKAPPGKN